MPISNSLEFGAGFARAEASRTALQAISSGGFVTWDTENLDNDNMVDVGGGNPERIVFNTDGTYVISAQFSYDEPSHVGTFTTASIRLNGSTPIAVQANVQATPVDAVNVGVVKDFVATDYIELLVFHDDGGTIDSKVLTNISVAQIL